MHFLYFVQLETSRERKFKKKQQKTTTCELKFIIYYFFHTSEKTCFLLKKRYSVGIDK